MQIIPALLVYTKEELEEQTKKVLPYFNHIAIDIADGLLVKDKTLDINQTINVLQKISPNLGKELIVDFDLIVQDYKKVVSRFVELPQNITIDTVIVRLNVISKEEFLYLQNSGKTFGIALDPVDSVETIDKKFGLNNLSVVQVLTIDPGAQGRPFQPEQLNKIEQLRVAGYRNKIFLDGAINDQTLPVIL